MSIPATSLTSPTLWAEYRRTRHPKLKARIAEENRGLAKTIAKRLCHMAPGEPLDDLVQLALIGLLKAIEGYDPERGAAFSSFAVPWIRGEILHWLRDHSPNSLKIPRDMRESRGRVLRLKQQAERRGLLISEIEAAQELGISVREWAEIADSTSYKEMENLDDYNHLTSEEGFDNQDLKRHIVALPTPLRHAIEAHWYLGKPTDATLLSEAMNRLRGALECA